ncbi:hypothetical protein SAMN05216337_1001208 [Bradyrhizobium brasilense]|uniref:Uncharacterized protein n=1 Tax=Bradyrhizobium brasilense TaxID=1419277 RepID=A0A1G6INT3_9BRAD|nr:hypothetical protein [Bradyrhizobium brasilense]SDC08168.1 hypothetical protein SAMN05216337_1001208 [Bradyrhizobium brasilense]
MKHLRCIGGPRHGSVIALSAHQTIVDLIDPKAPSERTRYFEHAVQAGGDVYFLAPANMATVEALRIALGPVGEPPVDLNAEIERLSAALAEMEADLNRPETADFMRGVPLEANHQRKRWGAEHDEGKSPLDWFWLIGYLAQKAASSAVAGDLEKAKHHTISTAAALANWHLQLSGADTSMRPGIADPETAA